MNIFLFQSEEFSRLYSCNKIHIEDVPLEKRQHFYKSIVLILLTIIYYILYVPCIILFTSTEKTLATNFCFL
uniref:Uncharacterized protein n=1 Tax=Ditylenchus dipsaci TaxID=166011 RepID=A0A915CTZ3_9BILA